MDESRSKEDPIQDKLRKLIERSQRLQESTHEGGQTASTPAFAALERLLAISNAMNCLTEREPLLVYIRDCLRDLFDAENSRVIMIDAEGGLSALDELDEEISDSLIERVIEQKRAVLVQDAASDAELSRRSSVQRLGLGSVLCAPLLVEDRVIGVLQFDYRNLPGQFTTEDVIVLELFAQHAATALTNMSLVERLQQTLDERGAAEAKLVEGERLRALGEMASGVAHDFNNLLTAILGLSDLIRRQYELPEQAERDLDALSAAADTSAATIRRLQEFAGHSPLGEDSKLLEPVRIVEQVVDMLRPRIESSRQPVHMIVEADSKATVLGGSASLCEVLLNLSINGLEAMPEGGTLTLRCFDSEGDVSERGVTPDSVTIEVEDTGPGIAPEVRARIFEPFFSTKTSGKGLGLSICWGITQAMGGSIEVRAGARTGSVFSIRLPSARSAASVGHGVEKKSYTVGTLRLLILDDDPRVLEVLCRMARSLGHEVAGAPGGSEGLALFDQREFDLVITDFDMPIMNGAEFAEAVRERGSECPILLLTSWNPGSLAGVSAGGNFTALLRKPITIRALADAVGAAVTAHG